MWRRRVVPTRVPIYHVDSGDCDWNGNGGRGLGTRGLCKGWNNSVGKTLRLETTSLFPSLSIFCIIYIFGGFLGRIVIEWKEASYRIDQLSMSSNTCNDVVSRC